MNEVQSDFLTLHCGKQCVWKNVSQVVLLCGQNSVSPSKVYLPTLSSWVIPSQLGNMKLYIMERNKRLWIRLSPEEESLFKQKASGYQTMSGMIRDAVRQFNDIGTVKRIEALNEMTDLYKKYQQELSWLGGNFNQAMKRANELAIGNSLSQKYYEDVIIPQAKHILMFLEKLKAEQTKIAKKLIKL